MAVVTVGSGWLRSDEVRVLCGIGRTRLWQLTESGKLEARREGKRNVYTEASVQRYIDEQHGGPRGTPHRPVKTSRWRSSPAAGTGVTSATTARCCVTFRYAVTDAVYGLDGDGRLGSSPSREGETTDLPADVADHFERRGYLYPRDNPAPRQPDGAGQPDGHRAAGWHRAGRGTAAKWVSATRPHGWPPGGVDPGYTSDRLRRHPDYENWRPD